MDVLRAGSIGTAALLAFVLAGCASGRAPAVDCDKRATPINQSPLIGTQVGSAEPNEEDPR